jgi:hypothetical protein
MTTLDRMKARDGRGLRDLEGRDVKPGIVKSFSEAVRSVASQK